MKKFCSETLKTLINELNTSNQTARQCISEKHLRKELLVSILTLTKSKYFVYYTVKLQY